MPSNWLVFDRIRALARQHRIYPAERVFQDQTHLDRILAGGEFLDFNQQSAILDASNLQLNRMERYKDYELMDQRGEISLALDLYSEESTLCDSEKKHTLIIRANNKRLKRELENLYYHILQWDSYNRPTVRYLCKFGDSPFEIIPDVNRSGVQSLRFMSVYNFTRIETRYGDLVGFFYQDPLHSQPQFMHPWQVMHLRLTSFENSFHPMGRSILEGGRRASKRLQLMEDAALVHRIVRSPERWKVIVPVGLIPPKEVPEYMEAIARRMKRQRFYNPATGTFDERYSPLVQDDMLFLPRRADGVGPDIEVLPGAENLDQIADIEYFKKAMVAPLKIPFSRVGIGEGAGETSEKSLSQSHSEFAKAVQWIQRMVAVGLTKVGIVHLALKGFSVDDLKGFEVALVSSSAMEELYRIETWQTRVAVMADLKELGWFPKEWIVTHFTDLSPDEIEELKDLEKEATGSGSLGLGGGGPKLDLGGPPEPGGGPPELDLSPDTGGPEELGPVQPLEGFDYRAERRVIMELQKRGEYKEAKKRLLQWAHKLGKGVAPSSRDINSGFDHYIESKELDGLTTTVSELPEQNGQFISPRDPNSDPGLLVEWSVGAKERDAVIKEHLESLESGMVTVPTDEEISVTDLPV